MKNNCKTTAEAIMASDSAFSADISRHCAACEECNRLAVSWEKLRSAKAMPATEIPLSVDFAVLTAAKNFTVKSNRHKVMIKRILYYSSAAACLLLACMIYLHEYRSQAAQNKIMQKSWDWTGFEKESFELNAAVEISSAYMTIGSNKNEALEKFVQNNFDYDTQ